MDTRKTGERCESLVSEYLQGLGYRIIARNYRCPYGEIDILAARDDVFCVVEVKSLSAEWSDDDIMYMVDSRKRARLRRTLGHFLAGCGNVGCKTIRFDVASVTDGKVTYYIGE